MMENEEKRLKSISIKMVVGLTITFLLGIFVGYQLDSGVIMKLQGYLYAIGGNATDSNATNSNVPNLNATDSNATSGNSTSTNNVLYLTHFALDKSTIVAGEKLNVYIGTSGADNIDASILFKSVTTNETFVLPVENIGNYPYVIVPLNTVANQYRVTELLLTGENHDGSTFTKNYSLTPNMNSSYFNFNSYLTVEDKNSPKEINLSKFSIEKNKTYANDKVGIQLSVDDTLEILKLEFESSENKKMVVYAQSLSAKPYIEIPSSVDVGIYNLQKVTLVSKDTTTIYTKNGSNGSKIFNFTSKIEIVNNSNNNTYIYNNEEINSKIITNLYNTSVGTEIIINASSQSIINEELFNVIKGKNKQLTIKYKDNQLEFNGRDITDVKSVDANMYLTLSKDNKDIGLLVEDGIILNLSSKGNLPGKALAKIKINNDIKDVLKNESIYVYKYDETTKKFIQVAAEINETIDGYYEFYINENSDYVFVDYELDDSIVTIEDDEKVIIFQKSNKVLLLLIGVGAVVIVLLLITIIVTSKKKKNHKIDDNSYNQNVNNMNSVSNTNAYNVTGTNNNKPIEDNKEIVDQNKNFDNRL